MNAKAFPAYKQKGIQEFVEANQMDFQEKLTQELYNAAKIILMDLFNNNEHYYYITLTTDGGANCISRSHASGLYKYRTSL